MSETFHPHYAVFATLRNQRIALMLSQGRIDVRGETDYVKNEVNITASCAR